jgi:hypothetical protein
LGLASGVCASDAIGRIEALAKSLLHRSPDPASEAGGTNARQNPSAGNGG